MTNDGITNEQRIEWLAFNRPTIILNHGMFYLAWTDEDGESKQVEAEYFTDAIDAAISPPASPEIPATPSAGSDQGSAQETAKLHEEIKTLKQIRAKFVWDHLNRICGECGHDKDDEGKCATCLTVLLQECPLLHTTTCNVAEKAWIERVRANAAPGQSDPAGSAAEEQQCPFQPRANRWTSYAQWDKSQTGVEWSDDLHDTEEQAEAVCEMLQMQGFGGEGQYFPRRTGVIPPASPEIPSTPSAGSAGSAITDTQRLDWLESDEGFAVITNVTAAEVLSSHSSITRRPKTVPPLREAIDAALRTNTPSALTRCRHCGQLKTEHCPDALFCPSGFHWNREQRFEPMRTNTPSAEPAPLTWTPQQTWIGGEGGDV